MILIGDCLEVMKTLDANSVDSIVTDPPYGLGFMGKAWDHEVPGAPFWIEMLRVAKPGAYLLAFCGTRTDHRMKCAIEDAGWEVRDTIMWVYGSGFPKSHNGEWGGTALKPAWEPITLARKPVEGTVAKNHAKHGTGGLNIDACRVGTESTLRERPPGSFGRINDDAWQPKVGQNGSELGRWPANLIHDGSDEVLAAFPETAPSKAANRGIQQRYDVSSPETARPKAGTDTARGHDDNGGSAARFFYCAKASKADRGEANGHPTVKPAALMRYLCRLVTPVGGKVMDPFMGSGSTGKAATLEGFDFIGIELDPEYALIAAARIEAAKAKPEPIMPQIGLFGEEQAA